uniref:DDE Tnp4 domain-containing protein n=1 Tax=Poecilia mexicana TaxID=48701 RepID=A0A3B3YH24_9TELE
MLSFGLRGGTPTCPAIAAAFTAVPAVHTVRMKRNGLRFFCFPRWKKHEDKLMSEMTRRNRMAWVTAVGRNDVTFDCILPSKRVRSLHFHSGKPAYEMLTTHPDWKSSLLLGQKEVRQEKEQQETPHTAEVLQKCQEEKEKREETGLSLPVEESSEENMLDQCALKQITSLKSELTELNLTELFLRGDKKVKYYTRLQSHSTSQVLLRRIKPFLPLVATKLTHFRMQEISNPAFEDMVAALYACMSSLVHWLDRERVWASMPQLFLETFGRQLAMIVDCFEVSTETTSNMESGDGHSDMVKYVTGITPQGVISFTSRESCGLLDKLQPRDVLLRFSMNTDMVCAEVKRSSPDGHRELDQKTAEETRRLTHIRSHVRRIIGSVCNKYKILSPSFPIRMIEPCEGEMETLLDKVVAVCCALINLCLSLQKGN